MKALTIKEWKDLYWNETLEKSLMREGSLADMDFINKIKKDVDEINKTIRSETSYHQLSFPF